MLVLRRRGKSWRLYGSAGNKHTSVMSRSVVSQPGECHVHCRREGDVSVCHFLDRPGCVMLPDRSQVVPFGLASQREAWGASRRQAAGPGGGARSPLVPEAGRQAVDGDGGSCGGTGCPGEEVIEAGASPWVSTQQPGYPGPARRPAKTCPRPRHPSVSLAVLGRCPLTPVCVQGWLGFASVPSRRTSRVELTC